MRQPSLTTVPSPTRERGALLRPRAIALSDGAAFARLALFVLALLVAMALRPAHAGPFEDALQKFQSDSYADTDAGVAALALSGNARAEAIVKALQDGRLLFGDGKVVIQTPGGQAVDAATGEALAAAPAGLSPVRVNNRVRRAIEAAMGSLTLLSPDPAKRLQAAEAVYRARDPGALPALQSALAKETDPRVKKAFAEARAAILLTSKDAPEADRLDAVETIRAKGDQDALGLLRSALPDAPPALKAKLDSAIAAIESRLSILSNIQNIWYGLSLGSVLLLAAIGLAITFGVMGIINMAHGEMVMIGAYVTYLVQEVFRASFPAYFGWSLPIAIPLAFAATALVGIIIERGIIRFLYGRPLETLLATWGVSLILQQAIRTAFGPTNREVGAPSYMSGSMDVLGLQITYGRLWIVCFALGVFILLQLILRATPFGLKMRAVTQNRRMAASMGIRTPRIDMMAFALGSGIAGIAGVALSQIDNVSPNLGQSYIVDSFMVVVFGGVGNLWGTLVAAFSLGIINKFLEPYAGAVLAKILVLVFIILFIQKRPRGLFALKGRAVEA